MSDDRKAVRVRIEGRVQGVWYRGWTVRAAKRLGLDGWVQNKADGSVEAVFSGHAATVGRMVERCRRGPPNALVTALRQEPFDEKVESGFRRR